jgi:hypothetical protein
VKTEADEERSSCVPRGARRKPESLGRVSADVSEPLIQREQASHSTTRGVGHERIGLPLQSFVRNRFHEVPEAAEIVSQFGG